MNNELNTNTVKEEQREENGMKNPQSVKVGKVTRIPVMTLDRAIDSIRNKKAKKVIINHIANLETEHDLANQDRRRLENENKALLLALEALGSKHKYMEHNLDYYKGRSFREMTVNRLSKSYDNIAFHNVNDEEMNY